MKRVTLLAAAFAVTTFMSAQDVLTHSVDNSYMDAASVACATNPDQMPGTGDESSSDNIFYRSYTPSNFGYSGDFEIEGANFFLSFSDIAGTDPTHNYTVRFLISDAAFPAGNFTEIGSVQLSATAVDDETLVEARLASPVTVPSSTEIIIAVDIPAAADAPNNYDIRIGINADGQNAPSYLTSAGCSIANPTPADQLGNFPDNNFILDLVGNGSLSTNEVVASQVSLFPNPVVDVLNITLPASVELQSATMNDLLGKQTQVLVGENNTIDMSQMAAGVYILKLETNQGSLTKKVIKQ